jgi:hypothetical protein
VKRLFTVLVLGGAILGVGVQPANATNECSRLPVCVRVAGPWVVVPAGVNAPRTRVDYLMSCPRGFIIGGLDAELSDRSIDIEFGGKLGSPVNPGVTTARSAVFRATYTGASPRTPSFRPHLGCVPTAGGGSGPVPFRVSATFPPGEPTVRRVRTVRLRTGTVRAFTACAAGERLIGGWHAIGFYTASPPSAFLIENVAAARSTHGARVDVRVVVGALQGARAVVQVGVVCGGGS